MKSYNKYKSLRWVKNDSNIIYSIEIVAKDSPIGRNFLNRDIMSFHYYKKGCHIYRFIHNSVFVIYNSNRYVILAPNGILMSEIL